MPFGIFWTLISGAKYKKLLDIVNYGKTIATRIIMKEAFAAALLLFE
jgi:hypothetical protein